MRLDTAVLINDPKLLPLTSTVFALAPPTARLGGGFGGAKLVSTFLSTTYM